MLDIWHEENELLRSEYPRGKRETQADYDLRMWNLTNKRLIEAEEYTYEVRSTSSV